MMIRIIMTGPITGLIIALIIGPDTGDIMHRTGFIVNGLGHGRRRGIAIVPVNTAHSGAPMVHSSRIKADAVSAVKLLISINLSRVSESFPGILYDYPELTYFLGSGLIDLSRR